MVSFADVRRCRGPGWRWLTCRWALRRGLRCWWRCPAVILAVTASGGPGLSRWSRARWRSGWFGAALGNSGVGSTLLDGDRLGGVGRAEPEQQAAKCEEEGERKPLADVRRWDASASWRDKCTLSASANLQPASETGHAGISMARALRSEAYPDLGGKSGSLDAHPTTSG